MVPAAIANGIDYPRNFQEFITRFATEEACRAYWIEARWGG